MKDNQWLRIAALATALATAVGLLAYWWAT